MKEAPPTWHSPCGIHAYRRPVRQCLVCVRALEEIRTSDPPESRWNEGVAPKTKLHYEPRKKRPWWKHRKGVEARV